MSMNLIILNFDVFLCFESDGEDLAFVSCKLHVPLFFPFLECVEIVLQRVAVGLCVNNPVKEAVVCK